MAEPVDPIRIWAEQDVPLASAPDKPNKVNPMDDLWEKGWDVGQKPACNHFNYVLNNMSQWLAYTKDALDSCVKSVDDIPPDATGNVELNAIKMTTATASFDLYTLAPADKRGLWYFPNDAFATAANHFPVVGNYGAGYCLAYPAPHGNTLAYTTWTGRTFINTVDSDGNYTGWQEQATQSWVNTNYYPLHRTTLTTEDLNTLNDFTKLGQYFCASSANATVARNYPVPEAGTLDVRTGSAGVQQVYITYSSHRMFVRSYYNGAWQAWTEIGGSTASLGASGWFKDNKTGLITQWGVTGIASPSHVTFPIEFPTACFVVIPTSLVPDGKRSTGIYAGSVTKSGCTIVSGEGGTSEHEAYAHYWIAKGH